MPGEPAFFVQLTDTHLFADPKERLWGASPDEELERTLAAVRPLGRPDFVLVTGDCSADGSRDSYARLASKIDSLGAPAYFMPGNHDDQRLMARVFGQRDAGPDGKFAQAFDACGWHFVLLDSAIPGEDGGEVGAAQLGWLERELRTSADKPVVVAVHHSPLALGSRWLDEMKLQDAQALLAVCAKPNVRAVLFGHVHQVHEEWRGGTLYASAPSTFYQFEPKSEDFAGDGLPPGARVCRLRGEKLETSVIRAK